MFWIKWCCGCSRSLIGAVIDAGDVYLCQAVVVFRGCKIISMRAMKMQKALRAYCEVLRLVRRLPEDSRAYYAKYARENFVNYRDADPADLQELLRRTYAHSLWVLTKYSVDESAAAKLKFVSEG